MDIPDTLPVNVSSVMDIADGQNAYQFRVDVHLDQHDIKFLDATIDKFQEYVTQKLRPETECTDYIISCETAPTSGKLHWQGILWFSTILTSNNMSQIRNYFRKYATATYQPVSFTKSIKPSSLASYVLKENDVPFITTLSEEDIAKIPKWRDSLEKVTPKKKKEQFEFRCKEYAESINYNREIYYTKPGGIMCGSREANERAIFSYLAEFSQNYFDIYKSPMRRMTGISILIKLGLLDHSSYVESLYGNFFR